MTRPPVHTPIPPDAVPRTVQWGMALTREAGPSDRPPEERPPPGQGLRVRAAAAARRAPRVYPGPVGEQLAEHLHAWRRVGYRFGGSALIMRLCDDVLRRPLPGAPAGDEEAT